MIDSARKRESLYYLVTEDEGKIQADKIKRNTKRRRTLANA